MPKVSFILPAYKKKFLYEAITSILNQSFTDFNLVVVDDASPEDLKAVVDAFSDRRLSYYRNEHNMGAENLVAAWNHAMKYATGEFCILASDDDVYHRDYLAKLLALSEKYPDVDLFHCRVGQIDETGKIFGYGDARAEYETCLDMLYFRGVRRYLQMAPDFMFRLSAWRKIGGFVDFPVAFYSDDATWFSLALNNGVVYSNSILLYFRFSGINISTRKDNIFPKVDATIKFMEWYPSFMDRITPVSDEEKAFKQHIFEHLYETSCNFIYYELGEASLTDSIQILKRLKMPNRVVRNNIIKLGLRKIIDSVIHFLSFNRL